MWWRTLSVGDGKKMATNRYRLRCQNFGHEKDVRAVASTILPDGGILSGSRDVTARIWVPNEGELTFREAHVMSGHNNFVSCVCVTPPDDQYPQGLILTGSNDHDILAFTLDSPQPVYKLEGHTNTVCSMAAGKFGTVLSGSWDTEARVWLRQKCVMTLQGHEAAVWAVALLPEGGFMLTGSADKTIKMWKAGRCDKTFTGHDDCVRGLAVLSAAEFLSCGNDSSVRRWTTTGACLQVLYGHTSYVYGVALLPDGQDFVTVGEDRTLRVWRGGECVQSVAHPAQSVWSVCVLANGDIVTGASDSVVRVFSAAPERQAEELEQQAYEELLAASTIPAQIGDIKTDQLSGPEALLNPGKKDGQTLMIKKDTVIEAHQWSAGDGRWVKIGDVVGGSGEGGEASAGKQMFEGKEYDLVFDVDLQEGQPSIRLPFNTSEDPWMAAHNWLEKNEISQMFLDQVAQFIIDQTKGITLGQSAAMDVDPFTGGGRYVPGSAPANGTESGGTDPFTGAGRYVPSGLSVPTPIASGPADPLTGSGSYRPAGSADANEFFPIENYLSFAQAKPDAIISAVKKFNADAGESSVREEDIDSLTAAMSGESTTAMHMELLWNLLQWPAGLIFPVLDVLRLAIRHPTLNQNFCGPPHGTRFLNFILECLAPASPDKNQMLGLRVLVNAFSQTPGETLLRAEHSRVIEAVVQLKDSTNKNVHVGTSTVLLNYSLCFRKAGDVESKCQCLSAADVIAQSQTDTEANFRLLVCVGTLVLGDENSSELARTKGLQGFVKRCRKVTDPAKVGTCARILNDLIN